MSELEETMKELAQGGSSSPLALALALALATPSLPRSSSLLCSTPRSCELAHRERGEERSDRTRSQVYTPAREGYCGYAII